MRDGSALASADSAVLLDDFLPTADSVGVVEYSPAAAAELACSAAESAGSVVAAGSTEQACSSVAQADSALSALDSSQGVQCHYSAGDLLAAYSPGASLLAAGSLAVGFPEADLPAAGLQGAGLPAAEILQGVCIPDDSLRSRVVCLEDVEQDAAVCNSADDSASCHHILDGWSMGPAVVDTTSQVGDRAAPILPNNRGCNKRGVIPNSIPIRPIPKVDCSRSKHRCQYPHRT